MTLLGDGIRPGWPVPAFGFVLAVSGAVALAHFSAVSTVVLEAAHQELPPLADEDDGRLRVGRV